MMVATLAVMALVMALSPARSVAQDAWPTRFITLVIPFGAGSGSDTVGRILAERMSAVLGQQVVIENVGGAGGTIGVSRVAKAAPDGYQFVMGAVDTFAQSQSLLRTPPYDAAHDFVPVGLAVEQPLVLLVRRELPVANLSEFASYVRDNHDHMQFGSSGVGSGPHLACFQLTRIFAAQVAHVPYRGSAPAIQDMIAGHLDFYCPLAAGVMGLIENKSVHALAVLTRQRSALLPELPTAAEQGVDGIDGTYWIGFFLPKGTPEPIAAKLTGALGTALETPSVEARLREVGTTVVPPERRGPAYLRGFVEREIASWSTTIKDSGIKLD